MAANADIFLEHAEWRRPLLWSTGLHAGFAAFVVAYALFIPSARGEGWGSGGGGDAMNAHLVSSVPLPAKPDATQNVLANESAGLTQSQPQARQNEPDAIAIQEKDARKKPQKDLNANRTRPLPPPEDTNVTPFGQGGPVSGPYSTFNAGNAQGGFGFTGGSGDFGSRYAWYVRVVQQKVSENWMKYEVDASIRDARRVYLTFDILRSGQPGNVQIEQSSGVPSLDVSAMRAIQRIDTFGPLPGDYSGGKVSVEFWFDYKR